MSTTTDINVHKYLKSKQLGDPITIQQGGEDPERVTLLRRGRKNLRVKKEEGDPFLVGLEEVVIETA